MDALWKHPDRHWELLLALIEDERVVPVVGTELLRDPEDPSTSLETRFARELEHRLDVSTGAAQPSLSEVACAHLANAGRLSEIYATLSRIVGETALPVPDALQKLAEIPAFPLYVATSFDGLLERALAETLAPGEPPPLVLAYSPRRPEDLPARLERIDRRVVYRLLGRVSPAPEFVVTEEDLLEFVHALASESRRPPHLFEELHDRSLLLIGLGYGGWLARLFLRLAKRDRLSRSQDVDVLADLAVRGDGELVLFLERFKASTLMFPGSPTEFVDELHRRWFERHPRGRLSLVRRAVIERETTVAHAATEMPRGAIFVSYASEDRALAEHVVAQLDAAGMNVWFDRQQLTVGEFFEQRIRRNIERASLFLPLITRHALAERRFFRHEWAKASVVAQMASPTPFIVPVAFDETLPSQGSLPDAIRDVHWLRPVGNALSATEIEQFRTLYRDYQRRHVEAL